MDLPAYNSEIAFSDTHGIPNVIGRPEMMDAWQHERMLQLVRPIMAVYPNAHWLTIGDSGADAWMLRQHGSKTITASSIGCAILLKLRELGHLDGIEVRALNAEHLELPNDSVDLVLCRQAYHHFRRAPLAFYEFMRVSRIGFVLIEPAELSARPFEIVRTITKLVLRRRKPSYDLFEPVGNYIYRVSAREILRMLTAVQLRWFAMKTFNDFYVEWNATQRRDSLLANLIFKVGVGVQDALCLCRLMSPGQCVVFVPTCPAGDSVQQTLQAASFRIVSVPRNPYTGDHQALHG
jgi:hypothetical protein